MGSEIKWLREDFNKFVDRHDIAHDRIEKKLDKLQVFKTKVIAFSSLAAFLLSILFRVFF